MDRSFSRERSAEVALEPRVSAIVAARSVGHALELCLRSALSEPWIDEVVIVDHHAPPQVSSALRALKADRRDVTLASAPEAAGMAAALNAGAGKARGRWLLFLDPHVVVQRGAVERMAAAGGGARAPYIVGGRLTDTHGRDQRAARTGALNAFSSIAVALGLPGLRVGRSRRGRGEPTLVSAVSGAFMLVPRAHFEALSGFDEGFATDAADLDLCRRAREAGGAVLFEPAASGIQFAGRRVAGRKRAQGLARFAVKSARTPLERAFALVARPALVVILAVRDFVIGRAPTPR